jgi:phosphatidylinositol alpha-mannosyltransferase
MRIALVTEFYYPHLGGVTEHVHNLALQFREWGHEVVIITANMRGQGPDAAFVRRVGTSVVIYANGSFARITMGWNLQRRIEEILREERIDLVHVHGGLAPTFGLVAPDAAWRLGIPVVATFHSWFPRSPLCRIFRRPLQRRLDRHAATIAVSVPVVEALSRYFETEWDIIPNGVDTEYFHPNGRSVTDAFDRGPRLLFLGRLDPRNGLDTAIEAMPSILKRLPESRLVVAGDGPLRRFYHEKARHLGDRVEFMGQVRDERPHIYGTADIYLCPTTKASFGITLLEAMACGTPMVVSDITGFRELVDGGEEASLVPTKDASAWAATVVDLIEDPARRERMAEAGRAKSADFSWPRVAQRVFDVYARVTK